MSQITHDGADGQDYPAVTPPILTTEVWVHPTCMFATHNFPCAICRDKHAVLDLNNGTMRPCWDCQKRGFETLRVPKWLRWLVKP